MTLRLGTTAALAILLPIIAHAQSDGTSCIKIDNDLDRLACYDQAYRAPTTETVTPPATLNSNWDVRIDKSKFEDTQDVYMSVRSTEPVQCRQYGEASRATLYIRCMENTTAMYLAGDCHFASGFQGYGKVDVRVDEKKAFAVNMEASTDNKALGLWRGNRSIPFVKKLINANSALFRMTPFGMSPVTIEFDITGFTEEIKPLRETCSW